MRSHVTLALVSCLVLAGAGCPPSGDGDGLPDEATEGSETPAPDVRSLWADTPLTDLARAETAQGLDATEAELDPVAFLARFDLGLADDGSEAPTRWLRVGVVLSDEGLRVFDARPLQVTVDDYGEALGSHPLAHLARGTADLPLLDAQACGALGPETLCGPLLALAAEARPPGALIGDSVPVRVAAGDRALVARGPNGTPVVLDLTVEGAPRGTVLTESHEGIPSTDPAIRPSRR